jgi:hypothetical protein
MEAALLAIIVAAGALATAVLNGVMMSRSKRQDYRRQDEVAEAAEERERRGRDEAEAREKRAADAAEEREQRLVERSHRVAYQAAEAARLLLADNAQRAEVLAAAGTVTNGKLDQIHTLVNSNLSKAIEDQLEATEQQLILLREVAELKRAAGREPSPEATAALQRIEAKVAELRTQVADRAAQTKAAAAQLPSPPCGT